jgi:hypothetical protein
MTKADQVPGDEFFESLMQRYTEAWNREDIDAIESFYNDPFFSYKDGALEVYADPVLGRSVDVGWIDLNRREGPATWERLSSSLEAPRPEQRRSGFATSGTCNDTGSEDASIPRAGPISELRESVMHKRAITSTTAAVLALFLVALPASADVDHAGFETSINWLLVVILTVLALAAFYYVLEVMNPGH